jgi:hypothetical protein
MRLVGSNESRIEKQKVKDEIGWKQRTGRGNGGETTLLHMLKDEVCLQFHRFIFSIIVTDVVLLE